MLLAVMTIIGEDIIKMITLFTCLIIYFLSANYLYPIEGNTWDKIRKDIYFEIIKPDELKYTYKTRPAFNFGTPFNKNWWPDVCRLVPVAPPDGCGWPKNAHELEGSVALVERGECSFLSKALKAEEVGALAVIVTDNEVKNDDVYLSMVDDKTNREVNIPVTFLIGKNGYVIRQTLKKMNLKEALIRIPVNMTYVPFHEMHQPPWVPW